MPRDPVHRFVRHMDISALSDQGDDRTYWQERSPTERIEALETCRALAFGREAVECRLQRVLEVADLKPD